MHDQTLHKGTTLCEHKRKQHNNHPQSRLQSQQLLPFHSTHNVPSCRRLPKSRIHSSARLPPTRTRSFSKRPTSTLRKFPLHESTRVKSLQLLLLTQLHWRIISIQTCRHCNISSNNEMNKLHLSRMKWRNLK